MSSPRSETSERNGNAIADAVADSPETMTEEEAHPNHAEKIHSTEDVDHAAVAHVEDARRSTGDGDGEEEDAEEDVGPEEYEDEEDEDEDESDDEEPALKYERIGGSLPDMFKKDSASALAIRNKTMYLGTHGGFIHMLDLTGQRLKTYKPHLASIVDIAVDDTADFISSASIDGQVVIISLSTPESYMFDMKRPMRTLALEPAFAKRSTRAFVSGGMAGSLVLREKGWLGHKETVLHTGEGPIWHVRWRGNLIAWANDLGVKIYDTASQTRITFIDRPADSPRADLFKCTLLWQDDSTLLIAWADHIKVARIRARPRPDHTSATAHLPPLLVEITAVFQLDCMIAGIVPHPTSTAPTANTPSLTSLLVLAYTPPDTSYNAERTDDRAAQARKLAERPELRIISRAGEELTADALSLAGFERWGCNDYAIAAVGDSESESGVGRKYVVLSPRDVVVVKPRDRRDHVAWLVERRRYAEALGELEKLELEEPIAQGEEEAVSAGQIGQMYIEHLVDEGDFVKAARLCPKVCGQDAKRWEDWIFFFAQQKQLQTIIPYVPTDTPRLGPLVYNMMLAHFLTHDRHTLLQTIKEWPKEIYDIAAVIVAVQSELDRCASSSKQPGAATPDSSILMESLAELYTLNRQPGKALPFFLRLRRPNVFDLIREHNLFTDVQDQALLLVEFDQELQEKRRQAGEDVGEGESEAITLLVDHIHSIPVGRVVQQLKSRPYYLFLYLRALFDIDQHLTSNFADEQVKLYAKYSPTKLIDFLRASNYYNLEAAYNVCKERDLVTEMVFLLGRMGNNKKALNLIIERLGDVHRAIEFAKDQNDDDLWEDLLKYSETRPAFIRGLLENVGADIDPIRLIRRIKNGLEIPGLKEALIKILHDFHLQISLLEGCRTILDGDAGGFTKRLQRDQTGGFFITAKSTCPVCTLPLQQNPQAVLLLFLCRHVVHSGCVAGGDDLPHQPDPALISVTMGGPATGYGVSGKIAFTSTVRARVTEGCPVCHRRGEGTRA